MRRLRRFEKVIEVCTAGMEVADRTFASYQLKARGLQRIGNAQVCPIATSKCAVLAPANPSPLVLQLGSD
jgi:hypothetical protein